MRIAVIGLGVLGASAARSLAVAGADVTVYERSEPLAGTSGTSFAWTNSHSKNPAAYHDLNVAGMAEHARLVEDAGASRTWHRATGNVEWAEEDAAASRLAASVAELQRRDYPAEWITPEHARELVPDLRIPSGVRDIAFYPTEGHIIPTLLLARLWGEARDHGAVLRCPAEVRGLTETRGGVRVELAEDTAEFDAALIATGRWAENLTAAAGYRIPVADPDAAGSATVGLLGYTAPLPARVNRVLTTPKLNVRPAGGGRLVVQGLDLDTDADPANPPARDGYHAARLCERLPQILAGTDGVHLESLRVGQRAIPADGLTVAGFLDETNRIYTLVTHSGMTLGPLLGRLAAHEVVHGTAADALSDFRPQRGLPESASPPLKPARLPGQQ